MIAYLDNAATTKPFTCVKEKMIETLEESYGNPSSLHSKGVEAEQYIKEARKIIASNLKVEEKEIIFQSMLNFKAFEKILSNKRGHRPGEMEQLYVQAIRTATNVKNRQTRAQDAGLAFLEEMIEKENLLEHKVLLFLLTPGLRIFHKAPPTTFA